MQKLAGTEAVVKCWLLNSLCDEAAEYGVLLALTVADCAAVIGLLA